IASEREENLVAEKAASRCDQDHRGQIKQAAMRSKACHDQDGLTLQQSTEQHGDVAVVIEQRLEVVVVHGASRTTLHPSPRSKNPRPTRQRVGAGALGSKVYPKMSPGGAAPVDPPRLERAFPKLPLHLAADRLPALAYPCMNAAIGDDLYIAIG